MSNKALNITFEGCELAGEPGDTIAHILLSHNIWQFGRFDPARGPFCNMGVCYDCQLCVHSEEENSVQTVRACVTLAKDGMQLSRFCDTKV